MLETVDVGAILVDWTYTRQFTQVRCPPDVRPCTIYPEANPVLGLHPSLQRVRFWCSTAILVHVLAMRIAPRPVREILQVATVVYEVDAINGSRQLGFHFKLEF